MRKKDEAREKEMRMWNEEENAIKERDNIELSRGGPNLVRKRTRSKRTKYKLVGNCEEKNNVRKENTKNKKSEKKETVIVIKNESIEKKKPAFRNIVMRREVSPGIKKISKIFETDENANQKRMKKLK